MKLNEIAAPLVVEGLVEPNTLLSVRNVVERGGKTPNTFELMVMTRLLQMLKDGTFTRVTTDPLAAGLSTSKELLDRLRALKPAELAKIAKGLLEILEIQDVNGFADYCNPEEGYTEYLNKIRRSGANEGLEAKDEVTEAKLSKTGLDLSGAKPEATPNSNSMLKRAASVRPKGSAWEDQKDERPAAACPKCGGWTGSGGMSQHSGPKAAPKLGRKGCTCNQKTTEALEDKA